MQNTDLSNNNSNAQKVRQFMEIFDQSLDCNIFDGRAATLRLLNLRVRLIDEEVEELHNAVEEFGDWATSATADPGERITAKRAAFVEMIDALTDLLYVTYGFFHAFGVEPDAAFDIVHRSNMSKLDDHGQPIYREDGKVLKGPYYQPPDFTGLLREYLTAAGEPIS